ncbi:MAG: nucleotidyltransferase family protein [Candidatus Edwardsbacteria bacterium]|nr:nucleotidyltransferase family protein [Candidatus Edwardsbacteria bacterium]
MTKNEIINAIRSHREILDRHRVRSMSLFGSYVRNEQQDGSDVDLLVEFENPTYRNYIGLLTELQNLVGCKIDLVCREGLKQRIVPLILEEAHAIR